MSTVLSEVKEKAPAILRHARVTRAAVFGSVARGEDGAESDIDLLVEMQRPFGLFTFLDTKLELEKVLGRKVDMIEFTRLKPRMRDAALRDAIEIL